MRYRYVALPTGRVLRIDNREPYRRRRFIVRLVIASVLGFALGILAQYAFPAVTAEKMGCYEIGTPCYEDMP